MDTAISSVLSEVRSGYASPPFDEVEKLIEEFIKRIGEMLTTEDPGVMGKIVALLREIIKAKDDFLMEKIMREKPEGGTPFTRALEKEKEVHSEPPKEPPKEPLREPQAPMAPPRRGTAPAMREDKD